MCRPGRDEATWSSPSQHSPHKAVCLGEALWSPPYPNFWPAQNKEGYAAI